MISKQILRAEDGGGAGKKKQTAFSLIWGTALPHYNVSRNSGQ